MSNEITSTEKVLIPVAPARIDKEAWMKLELPLQAALTAKGCIAAYSETPETDLAGTKANCTSEKEKAANKQNQDCIYIFIQSFQKNTKLMSRILRSKNLDWPDGRSWDIVKFINKEFKSANQAAEEKKMKSLAEITMGLTDDPQDLFDKIDTIDATYLSTSLKMDDKEKLLQCTSKLPKQLYGDAIRSCNTNWMKKKIPTHH